MPPTFCLWALWVGLLFAFPFLASMAVIYIVGRQRHRLGILMLLTGFTGGVMFGFAGYVLLMLLAHLPLSETTFSGWCIAFAGGFALGSLPARIWGRHV
jgi:hypothetical protein